MVELLNRYRHSEETKRKISFALKGKTAGRKRSEAAVKKGSESLKEAHKKKQWGFKKGHNPQHWLGKKHSPETIEKMRAARLKNNPMKNPDVVKKRSETLKRNGTFRGAKSNNWKGGKTKKSVLVRNSSEYKRWRLSVFIRDGYTCQECNDKSTAGNHVYLEAHHIRPFATHPELRFDVNNGLTLCRPCHSFKPKGVAVYAEY